MFLKKGVKLSWNVFSFDLSKSILKISSFFLFSSPKRRKFFMISCVFIGKGRFFGIFFKIKMA